MCCWGLISSYNSKKNEMPNLLLLLKESRIAYTTVHATHQDEYIYGWQCKSFTPQGQWQVNVLAGRQQVRKEMGSSGPDCSNPVRPTQLKCSGAHADLREILQCHLWHTAALHRPGNWSQRVTKPWTSHPRLRIMKTMSQQFNHG